MSNRDAFALIVGVGDYRAFDATGGADLAGPANDVLAWYRMAREDGVPPENIRICVAPALADGALGDDADGVTVTDATRAAVTDGLSWLAGALTEHREGKALLTWSGHGTRTQQGEVLCPQDVMAQRDHLNNALPLSEAADLLSARSPDSRITVFIDACHDDTGFNQGGRARGLPWSRAVDAPTGGTAAGLGDVVISSSETGKPSHELPTTCGITGAFSWAATDLLQRWGNAGDSTASGLTARELTARTGQMLAAMAVGQTPVYLGPAELADARIFSAVGDDDGVAAPQVLGGIEIWPETEGKVVRIKLRATTGEHLGTAFVTGGISGSTNGWTTYSRYWHWILDSSVNGGVSFEDYWPKATFTSDQPTEHTPTSISPPTSDFRRYVETSSQSNGSHTLSYLYYAIHKTTSGDVLAGYLEIDKDSSGNIDDDHVHVLTPSGGTSGATVLGGGDTAKFHYKPDNPNTVSFTNRFKDHKKAQSF